MHNILYHILYIYYICKKKKREHQFIYYLCYINQFSEKNFFLITTIISLSTSIFNSIAIFVFVFIIVFGSVNNLILTLRIFFLISSTKSMKFSELLPLFPLFLELEGLLTLNIFSFFFLLFFICLYIYLKFFETF